MKKNYFKKSLSLVLTVLMVMSCWVFVAPTEASAASTVTGNYNLSLVNSISFNNNVTTITDLNWAYNGDNQENEPNVYKNILYSSDCSGVTANTGSVNLKDSGAATIQWYHGATTFLYDGVTTPQTGVMVACIPKGSSYNIRTYSSYIVSGNGLSLPHMWYAYDGRANFMYVITAPRNTVAATADGSVNGTNAWTVNSNTWFANELQFTGSLGTNEYYRDITVRWGWKGNQKSQGTGNVYTYEATSGNHIYVINWKVLKDAYAKAQEYVNVVKANPDRYSTASVKNLKSICDALIAAHPNNYVNVSKNDPSGYGTAASNAISRLNSFSFSDKTVDVTFENIFSLSDWANSQSFEFDSSKGEVTVENNTTIKIYKSIAGSELTTGSSYSGNHSANRYSIPVTGGKNYTVKYDMANTSVNGTINTEVFLFWYKADGTPASTALNNGAFNGEGTHKVTFTAPSDAAMCEIRFDNDCPSSGSTVRFKNIAVYDADRAAAIDLENWGAFAVTKPYAYQAVLGTKYDVPTRNGYTFNGWYLDSDNDGVKDEGEEVTDAAGTIVSNLQSHKADVHYNLYADWKQLPIDVGYDNMFSLADWALTGSVTPNDANRGTITYDVMAGTITAAADADTGDGEIYTSYNADGYTVAVEPNTEYVFSAKMTTPSESVKAYGQMFIFCYDADGNGATGPIEIKDNGTESTASGQHIGIYPTTDGVHTIKFRTPANCYKLRIRVGATDNGVTEVYTDIAIFEKAVYDAYAKDYAIVRVPFEVGDTTKLTLAPKRDGYEFDGWYTADGDEVTDVSGYTASDIVYAHWIKKFTVTFKNYDGTEIKTEKVAPGAAATAPSAPGRAPDDNYEYIFAAWDTDAYKNVQSDLVVTATYSTKAHENISYTRIKAADCVNPGEITKTCDDCGYAWHDGNSFPDTTGEFAPALGHNYVTVVTGSSTGVDGTHKLACNRANCKYGENGGAATTTAAHNFVLDKDHPASDATCTVAGETYYKCACLEVKTETGTTNPNNHVNTEIRDDYAAECEKPGYSGDKWCIDCNTMIEKGSATAALEHKYTTYTYNDDATCFANGTETATCDLCGVKTDTREAADTKLKHTYTNYVYNNDAKCEVNGTETATCDHGCGTENTREAANTALEHDYTGDVKNNGNGTHSFLCKNNCGKYGATVDCSTWTPDGDNCKCTVCGYTKTHAWGDWSQAEGNTGDAAGKHTRTCKDCGAVDTPNCVYTEAKTPANCDDDAYTTYTCETCGHGYTVIHQGTATGHNFTGAYTYDAENDKHQQACVNADCTAKGVGSEKDAWADCVWSYANAGEGKHTASCECGNSEEQNCSGGLATCTTKAECQYCNTAYGDTADHVLTGTEKYLKKATDATCIANETYYKYCIGCENVFSDTETYEKPDTMTPHDYTCTDEYLYIATQAKCEVNETYYAYCSNSDCKKSSEDPNNTYEKADTALVHSWVNPVSNNDGTHTLSCENTNTDGWSCTATMTDDCIESAISFGLEPPTCTEQGYTNYQCAACGYAWKDNYVPALGHDYTKKIYTDVYLKEAANCEHANIYWYACSRCNRSAEEITEDEVYTGQAKFVTGEVREHNWKNVVDDKYLAEAATCLAAAKYYASCSYADCAKSAKDVAGEENRKFSNGSALNHDWVRPADDKLADYIATDPDCVTDATYYYTCSRAEQCKCTTSKGVTDETWTKENSKTGHKLTHTDAKAATCYVVGNYEYWYCSTCKKYFKDENATEAYLGQSATVIKKREHDIEKFAFKKATCEEDGHPAYEDCKYEDCDYTTLPADLSAYKATGHKFTGVWTCDTFVNYHSKACVNGCGASGMVIDGEQVKYELTFNDDDEAVVKGGVKCEFAFTAETVAGVHSHTLTCECGNKQSLTYSDEQTKVADGTVAPSCTAEGYDLHKCPDENCGATWKKNFKDKLDHNISDTAKSNGDGTHSFYCSNNCGYKEENVPCSGGKATCSAKAICDVCKTAYGEATGEHVLAEDGWTTKTPADCENAEVVEQKCGACGETIEETRGSKLGHKMSTPSYTAPEGWTGEMPHEPNCVEYGLKLSVCENGCGHYVLTEELKKDPTKHDVTVYDENGELLTPDQILGNCGTGLTYIYNCKREGCDGRQTVLVQDKHTYVVNAKVYGNCDVNGYIVYKCSVCGLTKTLDETVEGFGGTIEFEGLTVDTADLVKKGHAWGEDVVTKEPTCAMIGRGYKVCSNCNAVEEIEIEVIAHTLRTVKGYAATCTTPGIAEHQECLKCGYTENADNSKVIPANGHKDNGNGVCAVCGKKLEASTSRCGCICHKDSGFMQFIYKILRFFWKIFGKNKACSCGTVHY